MLTTNSDIFIEFICKVLTFVFHNKSKFKTQQESQTSSLRLITQENRNIREEVISIFTKNLAYIELVVEVLENIEGCSSNLIEL